MLWLLQMHEGCSLKCCSKSLITSNCCVQAKAVCFAFFYFSFFFLVGGCIDFMGLRLHCAELAIQHHALRTAGLCPPSAPQAEHIPTGRATCTEAQLSCGSLRPEQNTALWVSLGPRLAGCCIHQQCCRTHSPTLLWGLTSTALHCSLGLGGGSKLIYCSAAVLGKVNAS